MNCSKLLERKMPKSNRAKRESDRRRKKEARTRTGGKLVAYISYDVYKYV